MNDLIDFIPYADKALWESQRLVAYTALAGKTKKQLKLTDLLKFKWDEHEKVSKKMTDDIKRRMKALANVKWTTSSEGLDFKQVMKETTMAQANLLNG